VKIPTVGNNNAIEIYSHRVVKKLKIDEKIGKLSFV